jgi:hypothetical protein
MLLLYLPAQSCHVVWYMDTNIADSTLRIDSPKTFAIIYQTARNFIPEDHNLIRLLVINLRHIYLSNLPYRYLLHIVCQ